MIKDCSDLDTVQASGAKSFLVPLHKSFFVPDLSKNSQKENFCILDINRKLAVREDKQT